VKRNISKKYFLLITYPNIRQRQTNIKLRMNTGRKKRRWKKRENGYENVIN